MKTKTKCSNASERGEHIKDQIGSGGSSYKFSNENKQECKECWRMTGAGVDICPYCKKKVEPKASWEEQIKGSIMTAVLNWSKPEKTKEVQNYTINFISSLLSSTKQQIVNEIVEEGNQLKIITPDKKPDFTEEEMDSYNQAIQDYQNLIKSKYE